uniref:Knottins-like domain-containing protein n=1 Tax=Setaria viridis TaxID=4556 RepID=A0A4U6TIE6_SETVI|nr:hypothetical protein SEVIR_8G144200v2 [Setaria viridis]
MAVSRKNLSAAAAAAAVLILIAMAAEMASVGAADTCRQLSGAFHGLCASNQICGMVCATESSNNIGGVCDDTWPRCYCIYNC